MKRSESVKLKEWKSTHFSFGEDFSEGLAISVDGRNNGVVLFVNAPSGGELVIAASDCVFGGVDKHIEVSSGEMFMAVDIGSLVQQSGEYKGCVVFKPNDLGGQVAIYELV